MCVSILGNIQKRHSASLVGCMGVVEGINTSRNTLFSLLFSLPSIKLMDLSLSRPPSFPFPFSISFFFFPLYFSSLITFFTPLISSSLPPFPSSFSSFFLSFPPFFPPSPFLSLSTPHHTWGSPIWRKGQRCSQAGRQEDMRAA